MRRRPNTPEDCWKNKKTKKKKHTKQKEEGQKEIGWGWAGGLMLGRTGGSGQEG